MARSDRSRPSDDEPRRRSQPALTLSTGRLEGRPSSAAEARRSGNRHNPLRDEYPSRRDDPRPSRAFDEPSPTRHRRYAQGDRSERPRRSDHPERDTRTERRSSRSSAAPFGPLVSQPASTGRRGRASHRPPLDLRTLFLGGVVVVLAVIFLMALLHVGPFSKPQQQDPAKHVGALGLAAVASNASSLSQNIATQVSLAVPVEPELDKLPAHTPTREDIESLPDQKAPFAFAFVTDDSTPAPVLSDRSLVALSNALAYYDTDGREASYLMMDMTTGRGIAGNLDASIYGASSFKGPFCVYVTQRELPNDINAASTSRTTQIENAIIYSDNASYGQLRSDFGTAGIKEWLGEAGVSEAIADDTYFPTYTGRQSALMWLKIYDYLENTDTSAAQWLSDTFAKTEVSFLRNGALGTSSAGHTDYLPAEGSGEEEEEQEVELAIDVADGTAPEDDAQLAVTLADDGEGEEQVEPAPVVDSLGDSVVVRNKAGWIAGEEDDAICDSGIVTINGHNYLMVVMTSAADSAEGEQAFAHLARTLFEIRGDLV